MFKSLGKALSLGKSKSSKSDPPPTLATKHGVQLTKMAMVGLITTVGFLNEHSFQSDGLFIKNGDKAETEDTEKFILGGIISVGYLQSVKNILSITTAVRNIFTNHGPLIPSHYYEMFMSPLANLEQLILTIPSKNKELLESLMSLLAKITQIQNKQTKANIANLGSSLGILLFRDDEAPYTALDKDSLEYVNRIKVFNKLLTIFSNRLSKQMADASPRNIAAANAAAASASNKFNFANAPQQANANTVESAQSAAPAPETHSIQDRSVKISFMGMSEKPDSETLQELCLKYGTVLNVGFKGDKFAVVLFSDPHEAFYCATDQDGKGLGDHFKIKYLGTKSYSTPSPPPPQPRPAAAVIAPQEELDDSVFVTPAELHSHEPPTFEDDDQTAAAPTPLKQVKTIPVKSTAVPVSAAAAAELQKSADSLDMVTEIKPLYPSARDRKKEEVMEVSSFYSRANTPLPGSAGGNNTGGGGGGGEGSKKGASPRKRNNKDFVPSPASNKAQQDRLRAMTVSTTNTSPDHRNLNDAERSSPEGTVSSRGTAPFSEDEEGADGNAALTTESLKRHSGGHHQPNQSLGIIDLSMISAHNDNTILHTATKQPLSAATRNNAPAKGKVDGAEKVEKKHQFFTFDSGSETSDVRSRSRLDTEESASVASGVSHLEGTQFATQGQNKAAGSAAPANLWSTIASKSKGKKVNKTNDSVAEIDNSRNNNTSGSSSGGWKVATKSPMSSPPTKLSTHQADMSHTPNALSLLSHRSEVEDGGDGSPDKRSDKKLSHAQQRKASPLHIHTHNNDHNHTITEYKSPASPTSGANTGRSSVNDEEDQGLMYSPGSVSSSVVKRQVRTIHVSSPRELQQDNHNNRDGAHRDSSYNKVGRHSDRSQDNSRSASKSSGNASHISSTDSAVEFAADYASQLHVDSTDSAVDFAGDYESQLQDEDWSPPYKQHQQSELDHSRPRNDHREGRRDMSISKQHQQQQQQQRRSSRGDHTNGDNANNTIAMSSRSAIERSYNRHVSPQLRAASDGSDRILDANKGNSSGVHAQINMAAMHSLNGPNALNTLNTAVHAPSAFSTHYNPAAEHVIGHLQQASEGSRPLLQAQQQNPHMSSPERLQKAKQDYLAYTALLHSQAAFNKQHTNRLISGQFSNNGGGDNSLLVLELQRQLQQMQAQVMMYQAKEADQIAESIRTEQAFQAETLALQLRVTQVESENSDLRETVRKLKLSQSHSTSTIMSLESAKKSLEMIVSSAQETAHRESLSTILAQQRLIGVLESTVTQLSTQAEKLHAELAQSRNVQYDSAKEGNKWKAAALSGDAAATADDAFKNDMQLSDEQQQEQQQRQVVVRFTDDQSSESKEGPHHSGSGSISGGEGAGEAKGGSPIHKALVAAVGDGDELSALRRDANQEMISFMDRMPAENKGYKSTFAEHRQLALQLLHKPTHNHDTDGYEDENGSSSSDPSGGDVVNVTNIERGRAEVAGAVLRKIATAHSSPLKKQHGQQSSSGISGNTNSSSGGNKNRGEYIYSNDSHTVTYLPLSTTTDGKTNDNQHSARTRSELSRGVNGGSILGSGVVDSEVPYSEQILEKVNQRHDQRAVYQLPYNNTISQQQHQFQVPPLPPPKYTPPDLIHTTPVFGAASISTIGLYDRIHSKIGSDFLTAGSSSNRGSNGENNRENSNSSKPAYLSVKELYSSYGREPVHSAGAGYIVTNSGSNSRSSSGISNNKQYNNSQQQLQQQKNSSDYHSDILRQHALNMSKNNSSSGSGKSSMAATRNSNSGGEWYSQKYE